MGLDVAGGSRRAARRARDPASPRRLRGGADAAQAPAGRPRPARHHGRRAWASPRVVLTPAALLRAARARRRAPTRWRRCSCSGCSARPRRSCSSASLIAEVGPGRALVITYVNPVVAVALGVAILGERPGAGAIAGLLLILAGSWLSTDGRLPPGLAAAVGRLALAGAERRRSGGDRAARQSGHARLRGCVSAMVPGHGRTHAVHTWHLLLGRPQPRATRRARRPSTPACSAGRRRPALGDGVYYSMQQIGGKSVAAISPQPEAQREAGVRRFGTRTLTVRARTTPPRRRPTWAAPSTPRRST